MGDVVNLRRIRKSRDRAEKAEEAARNRAKFGRTASERDAAASEVLRHGRLLDRHRLESPGGDEPPA